MDIHVIAIPVLTDNYVWAMINTLKRCALIVDPGESEPVIEYLEKNELSLSGILITHHHWDHTAGIPHLVSHYNAPVYRYPKAPNLHPNATVSIAFFPTFQLMAIPGHTLDHIAYYAEPRLFCGDTLFSAGCGRVFEGTAEELYTSLQSIAALPNDTWIYCAHEYTLANLRFAQHVEPQNPHIADRIKEVMQYRNANKPSLPSRLSIEKATNPFLRCDIPQIIQQVEQHTKRSLKNPIEVFSELRKWKNNF